MLKASQTTLFAMLELRNRSKLDKKGMDVLALDVSNTQYYGISSFQFIYLLRKQIFKNKQANNAIKLFLYISDL